MATTVKAKESVNRVLVLADEPDKQTDEAISSAKSVKVEKLVNEGASVDEVPESLR